MTRPAHHRTIRNHRKSFVGTIALAMLAVVGLVASAGTMSGTPTETRTAVTQLNAADRQAMQARVDDVLRKSVGGKRISINQIAFEGGEVILTLPLPGERQARAVDEPVVPLGTANCSYEYACLYDGTWFDGARLSLRPCGRVYLPNYGFGNIASSIHNNQTGGTQTYIMNSSLQILNANLAPSRVNDVGIGAANKAVYWQVC